jgi:nucleotide-binding universal stress UspA family protein
VLEDFPRLTDLESAMAEAAKQMEEIVPAHEGWMIKSLVRVGKPYQQIIQLAVAAQTDVVIMGVRGRGALDRAVFGSTTYRVVQLGPCPVLAVHHRCDLQACTISLWRGHSSWRSFLSSSWWSRLGRVRHFEVRL